MPGNIWLVGTGIINITVTKDGQPPGDPQYPSLCQGTQHITTYYTEFPHLNRSNLAPGPTNPSFVTIDHFLGRISYIQWILLSDCFLLLTSRLQRGFLAISNDFSFAAGLVVTIYSPPLAVIYGQDCYQRSSRSGLSSMAFAESLKITICTLVNFQSF